MSSEIYDQLIELIDNYRNTKFLSTQSTIIKTKHEATVETSANNAIYIRRLIKSMLKNPNIPYTETKVYITVESIPSSFNIIQLLKLFGLYKQNDTFVVCRNVILEDRVAVLNKLREAYIDETSTLTIDLKLEDLTTNYTTPPLTGGTRVGETNTFHNCTIKLLSSAHEGLTGPLVVVNVNGTLKKFTYVGHASITNDGGIIITSGDYTFIYGGTSTISFVNFGSIYMYDNETDFSYVSQLRPAFESTDVNLSKLFLHCVMHMINSPTYVSILFAGVNTITADIEAKYNSFLNLSKNGKDYEYYLKSVFKDIKYEIDTTDMQRIAEFINYYVFDDRPDTTVNGYRQILLQSLSNHPVEFIESIEPATNSIFDNEVMYKFMTRYRNIDINVLHYMYINNEDPTSYINNIMDMMIERTKEELSMYEHISNTVMCTATTLKNVATCYTMLYNILYYELHKPVVYPESQISGLISHVNIVIRCIRQATLTLGDQPTMDGDIYPSIINYIYEKFSTLVGYIYQTNDLVVSFETETQAVLNIKKLFAVLVVRLESMFDSCALMWVGVYFNLSVNESLHDRIYKNVSLINYLITNVQKTDDTLVFAQLSAALTSINLGVMVDDSATTKPTIAEYTNKFLFDVGTTTTWSIVEGNGSFNKIILRIVKNMKSIYNNSAKAVLNQHAGYITNLAQGYESQFAVQDVNTIFPVNQTLFETKTFNYPIVDAEPQKAQELNLAIYNHYKAVHALHRSKYNNQLSYAVANTAMSSLIDSIYVANQNVFTEILDSVHNSILNLPSESTLRLSTKVEGYLVSVQTLIPEMLYPDVQLRCTMINHLLHSLYLTYSSYIKSPAVDELYLSLTEIALITYYYHININNEYTIIQDFTTTMINILDTQTPINGYEQIYEYYKAYIRMLNEFSVSKCLPKKATLVCCDLSYDFYISFKRLKIVLADSFTKSYLQQISDMLEYVIGGIILRNLTDITPFHTKILRYRMLYKRIYTLYKILELFMRYIKNMIVDQQQLADQLDTETRNIIDKITNFVGSYGVGTTLFQFVSADILQSIESVFLLNADVNSVVDELNSSIQLLCALYVDIYTINFSNSDDITVLSSGVGTIKFNEYGTTLRRLVNGLPNFGTVIGVESLLDWANYVDMLRTVPINQEISNFIDLYDQFREAFKLYLQNTIHTFTV